MLVGSSTDLTDLVRDNPAAIAAYLTEIFKENDAIKAQKALNLVMLAQNVQILARDAGLRRDTLYRTFSGRTNPQISRVLRLFDSMNVKARIKPNCHLGAAGTAAARLSEGFAANDPQEAIRALSVIVKSHNITALALELGIMRTTVYKTFGGKVDPQLSRVLNLFAILQVRFAMEAMQPRDRPPHPKLGRPRKEHPEG